MPENIRTPDRGLGRAAVFYVSRRLALSGIVLRGLCPESFASDLRSVRVILSKFNSLTLAGGTKPSPRSHRRRFRKGCSGE
jgi:hypothetical protein